MWDLTALLWGKTETGLPGPWNLFAEQADLGPCSPPMGVKIQAGLLIWAVKVRLAGVWLGDAISKWNGHRPFGHFLGPSWTSPGLSATSWAHLKGRGKQVQAFRPLFGLYWGAGQTSPGLSGHFLGFSILGGGETSPGLSAHFLGLSWGWGNQVQAFRPLLGSMLGGGAKKSRPFGHFLGPSWGVGQTSPALSATSWAHLGGWGKQVLPIVGLFGLVCPAPRSDRKACGLVCPTPQDEPKKSEGLNGKERQRRGVVGRCHKQMEWARSEKGGLFLFFPIAGL